MLRIANRIWLTTALALVFALSWGVATAATENSATTSSTSEQTAAETSKPSQAQEVDGAKVYAWTCGSCHSERRPKERTDADWEVIMMHMRVRANLTAAQTRAVLDYLQENN